MPRKSSIKKSSTRNTPRFRKVRGGGLRDINKTINFDRESKKSNARKWPTDVICIECKKKFTLPFKPRKPEVYCDDCFKKPTSFEKHTLKKKKLASKKYFFKSKQ